MSDELELTYPSGLITKTKIDDGEFTILTDYQEERGGYNKFYIVLTSLVLISVSVREIYLWLF